MTNLLYSCPRCNQYKADYWPVQTEDPVLWNPREEPRERHFLLLPDGTLVPLSPTGEFTLKHLHLNRLPLVTFRLRKLAQNISQDLLARYQDLVTALTQLHRQQAALLEEQHTLLEEQHALLLFLLRQKP